VILVDAGPLVAIGDSRSADHVRSLDALRTAQAPRLVPAPIIAEVCHLLGTRLGSSVEAAFLERLATPVFTVVAPQDDDLLRAAELVRQYGDLPIGGTDALVVAIAERLNVTTVATLDQRHFRVVRPKHVPAFTLIPE
jgi:uncharacterized protein